jgi:Fur family transcriptional regulator, ferric uptake regulator
MKTQDHRGGSRMQRDTKQRRAIREALERAGLPLSPKEVLDLAKPTVPGLGIATVYRNLKALLEEEWLVAVELPGEPPRYEIAGKGHHHHFHCRECDRVFDVKECPGNLQAVTPKGFRLERHEFVLYGLCPACAA